MDVAALIALGGNLGDVEVTLVAARSMLATLPETSVVASSSLYQTSAIGFGEQPDYLNAALAVRTGLTAADLLRRMHTIEDHFGRERIARWGARTLDLDLLAYSDICCDEADLQLPHPRISERMFVLVPLMEIAADWCHPRLGLTVAQMEHGLRKSDPTQRVQLVRSDCGWM